MINNWKVHIDDWKSQNKKQILNNKSKGIQKHLKFNKIFGRNNHFGFMLHIEFFKSYCNLSNWLKWNSQFFVA